jgi:hypothetical protein
VPFVAPLLYDPTQHRALDGRSWSEASARAAIDAIACDAIDAYRGPEQLWPNASDDLEGDPDVPFRSAYLGASGVAWALDWATSAGWTAHACSRWTRRPTSTGAARPTVAVHALHRRHRRCPPAAQLRQRRRRVPLPRDAQPVIQHPKPFHGNGRGVSAGVRHALSPPALADLRPAPMPLCWIAVRRSAPSIS